MLYFTQGPSENLQFQLPEGMGDSLCGSGMNPENSWVVPGIERSSEPRQEAQYFIILQKQIHNFRC